MYHTAEKLAILAEKGLGYKKALYSDKNKKNVKSIYFLVTNAVKKRTVIDELLSLVGLTNEVKSQIWLARVLVTELLWGRTTLPPHDPLFRRISRFKKQFEDLLPTIENQCEDSAVIPRYIRINNEAHTWISAVSILEERGFTKVPTPAAYDEYLSSLKSLSEKEFMFDFHVPYLIVFSRKAKIDALSPIDFIRQDKSSCLVSLLLAPIPGSTILDICAAPGYKTQHASSLIHKMGQIYSVDINKERYKTLQSTCNNFELDECVTPLNMDALKTSSEVCPNVEFIIVDPPCSGTGIMNTLIRHSADGHRLEKLSNLQAMILKHALTQFPCSRRVVYSTCSTEMKENEGVVAECLETAEAQGFKLVPLASSFKGSFQTGTGPYSCSPHVLRLCPERDLTNGFFIALFERSVPPSAPLFRPVELSTRSKDTPEESVQDKKKIKGKIKSDSLLSLKNKNNSSRCLSEKSKTKFKKAKVTKKMKFKSQAFTHKFVNGEKNATKIKKQKLKQS